jgi:hypothetical protein
MKAALTLCLVALLSAPAFATETREVWVFDHGSLYLAESGEVFEEGDLRILFSVEGVHKQLKHRLKRKLKRGLYKRGVWRVNGGVARAELRRFNGLKVRVSGFFGERVARIDAVEAPVARIRGTLVERAPLGLRGERVSRPGLRLAKGRTLALHGWPDWRLVKRGDALTVRGWRVVTGTAPPVLVFHSLYAEARAKARTLRERSIDRRGRQGAPIPKGFRSDYPRTTHAHFPSGSSLPTGSPLWVAPAPQPLRVHGLEQPQIALWVQPFDARASDRLSDWALVRRGQPTGLGILLWDQVQPRSLDPTGVVAKGTATVKASAKKLSQGAAQQLDP